MSPGTRKNMMQEQLDREESELAKYENAINELQQELDHANDLVREKEEECRNISQQHESEVSNLEEQINTLSQVSHSPPCLITLSSFFLNQKQKLPNT